ncbi:MAG: hypothetical protein IBX68_12120 [Dehalococcoidia bacterium]|nr:hypothetical protein [Dehalococcoidia bacterium]
MLEDLMTGEELGAYQGQRAHFLPQIIYENKDTGLPLSFAGTRRDALAWSTTISRKTIALEVTGIGLLSQKQMEGAFALSTARVSRVVKGRELPFAGAARGKLWWLATINDKLVQVEVSGIRGLTERQLEDAFSGSVAVIDGNGVGTAMKPQTQKRKPSRENVEIGSWAERDRLGIWLTDKRTGETVAEWWDEDARRMFEDGLFKPGRIQQQSISGREFEGSVLDYSEDMGILGKSAGSAAVVPAGPRPRRRLRREELEFLPDSPEFLAYTIEDIGYRDRIDNAFQQAILRAKGLK